MHSVIFLHIFFLFLGERLFRGYKELCTHTDRLAEISHIVFVVHGVGQVIKFFQNQFTNFIEKRKHLQKFSKKI